MDVVWLKTGSHFNIVRNDYGRRMAVQSSLKTHGHGLAVYGWAIDNFLWPLQLSPMVRADDCKTIEDTSMTIHEIGKTCWHSDTFVGWVGIPTGGGHPTGSSLHSLKTTMITASFP